MVREESCPCNVAESRPGGTGPGLRKWTGVLYGQIWAAEGISHGVFFSRPPAGAPHSTHRRGRDLLILEEASNHGTFLDSTE